MNTYIYPHDFIGPPQLFCGPLKPIYIRSEADAMALLERALNEDPELNNVTLLFDGWPILKVRYTGEQFHSSITADVASAIVDTQKAINKTFALLVHNSKSSSSLKEHERKELEIVATIKEGSAIIEFIFGKFGDALANGMVSKMTGNQLVVLALGGLAIWGTYSTAKHFISTRSAERGMQAMANQAQQISAEETKRTEILAKALTAQPQLRSVQKETDKVAESYIQAGTKAETVAINDIELTGEDAKELTKTEPARSSPVQPNGTYRIYTIGFKSEDSITVSIMNLATGLEFNASFTDHSLDQEQINILKDASFSRQPIYLSINAKQLRDEIIDAEIISVTQQPLIP